MEAMAIKELVEALEAEREARRQAEREIDRLRRALAGDGGATQRSRFLMSMGHTLRTPLNAILGFSEILEQEQCGPLTERQCKLVRRIGEAGRRQLGLVNNLIDLARIHAGEMTLALQGVDLMQLVHSVAVEHAAAAEAGGVKLSVHGEGSRLVECDPEYLRQALVNLVDNAVRFTESGGAVRVVVSRDARSDADDRDVDAVSITVADSGPGIPPDDQPLLFDDFEHAESLSSRRQRRSGVGLALARRIVELHGGRIWVESSGVKGEGSRFVIEFPAQAGMRSAA